MMKTEGLQRGLPACALKTADPFLNNVFNLPKPAKKDGRFLGIAKDVNILATIETLFKRGGFLEVRNTQTLC
jgi:hypothetical protein